MAGAFDEINGQSYNLGFNELSMYALKTDAMLSVIMATQAKILARLEGKSEEEVHAIMQDEVEAALVDNIKNVMDNQKDDVL